MITKTITFVDYNGKERTEEFLFNINCAEVIEMEGSSDDGYDGMIKRITSEQNNKKILEIFKDLILRAYGKKSEDGKRFIKSPELSKEFSETGAYVELYMELFMNHGAASAFVNGVFPTKEEMQRYIGKSNN